MKRGKRNGEQRELMRALYAKHSGDPFKVCVEYAAADRRGLVPHKSNRNRIAPEKYAVALWYDGMTKGWLLPQCGSDYLVSWPSLRTIMANLACESPKPNPVF